MSGEINDAGPSNGHEIVGLVGLVAVVVGLLCYKAYDAGLYGGLFLVVVGGVSIGLILTLKTPASRDFLIRGALFAAALIAIVYLIYALTRNLLDGLTVIMALTAVNLSGSRNEYALIFLVPVTFIFTFAISVFAGLGGRMLIAGATNLFSFGARGVTKVHTLLAALIALVGLLVTFLKIYL
jgi:hypothetical protein